MRLALLSDIHGNLEALGAVVGEGHERGVDAWVCVGDIDGYGVNPRTCLHAVQELTDEVVDGNHDAAAIGQTDLAYFNSYARRAAEWTAEQLYESERRYLASLPFDLQRDHAFFVQAEPRQPSRWGYVHDRAEAKKALEAIEQRFCFVGHSHCPVVCIERNGGMELLPKGPQAIKPLSRYLANIGSVGQPREGNAPTCFALWDQTAETLELVAAFTT